MIYFACAQEKDSLAVKPSLKTKTINLLKKSLEGGGSLINEPDTRSDLPFEKFKGKIIRSINVQVLDFGEEVTDTVTTKKKFFARVANKLQPGTHEHTIRSLLFIHIGDSVKPNIMADNERYIRDRDFVKDARIYIYSVKKSDSVDVYVVTSDVFSIGADFTVYEYNRYKGSVYDVNMGGRAFKLRYSALFDQTRRPPFGSQIFMKKTSIFGSLADLELAYTTINSGVSLGEEDEDAAYIKLNRPLYSNYMHFAGGLSLSDNISVNHFSKSDSAFLKYHYQVYDVWGGINLTTRLEKTPDEIIIRKFVALRVFDQQYLNHHPVDSFTIIYSNKLFVISELNFYKLDFFRTRYIYGFGRTEDVPYGFNTKFSLGRMQYDDKKSIYVAGEHQQIRTNLKGDFLLYNVGISSNIYSSAFKDNVIRLYGGWFSRLKKINNMKLRHFASIAYVNVIKQSLNNNLKIDNRFGLIDFSNNDQKGSQRLTANANTNLYTQMSLLGFKIGFFSFGELTFLAEDNHAFSNSQTYSTIGAGIRVRNENLIFGTIQFKAAYSARPLPGVNPFELGVSSNLKLKFSGSYANAPTFPVLE